MNWQWIVFLIGAYVIGAYILRNTMDPKNSMDYTGVAVVFLFSPIWAWVWISIFIVEKGTVGIGRWISGK